jgi:hypothetical protein
MSTSNSTGCDEAAVVNINTSDSTERDATPSPFPLTNNMRSVFALSVCAQCLNTCNLSKSAKCVFTCHVFSSPKGSWSPTSISLGHECSWSPTSIPSHIDVPRQRHPGIRAYVTLEEEACVRRAHPLHMPHACFMYTQRAEVQGQNRLVKKCVHLCI